MLLESRAPGKLRYRYLIRKEGRNNRIFLRVQSMSQIVYLAWLTLRILKKKGNTQYIKKQTIRYDSQNTGRDLIKMIPTQSHYLLEDNPPKEGGNLLASQLVAMSARGERILALLQTSQATKEVRHRRIGYLGDELLHYLRKAVKYIEIIDQDQDSNPRFAYRNYKLASAPRQVLRRPIARGDRLQQFIHFNIILAQLSQDKYNTCFIYFYCSFSYYHEVRCMGNKGEVTRQIKAFYQLLYNKGFRPKTYHTNWECSLGNEL